MSILIRPSSIGSFFNCPYRWAQVHLNGIRSFSNFNTLRGTAVHAGAEMIWRESQQAGEKRFSLSAAQDAAAESVKKTMEKEEVRLFDFETPEQAKDAAAAAVEVYAKQIVPQVDIPVAVEQYFDAEIDDGITIGGTCDAIAADGTIRDIKTSTKKKQPTEYIEQLSIYSRLAEVSDISISGKGVIENIVFGKNEIVAHIMPFDLDIAGTRRKLDDLVRRIKWVQERPNDIDIAFPPNPKSYLCDERYCPLYEACYIRSEVPF